MKEGNEAHHILIKICMKMKMNKKIEEDGYIRGNGRVVPSFGIDSVRESLISSYGSSQRQNPPSINSRNCFTPMAAHTCLFGRLL